MKATCLLLASNIKKIHTDKSLIHCLIYLVFQNQCPTSPTLQKVWTYMKGTIHAMLSTRKPDFLPNFPPSHLPTYIILYSLRRYCETMLRLITCLCISPQANKTASCIQCCSVCQHFPPRLYILQFSSCTLVTLSFFMPC